jgi:signal transduction histidine kinase
MLRLRDLPIQRKLRVVMLATCSVALVVACGALFALQFLLFRNDFARDLSATARLIGLYSSAVLQSGSATDAARLLASLKAKPTVIAASIVFPDGRVLASFGETSPARPALPAEGVHQEGGQFVCVLPVFEGFERVGSVLLRADYRAQATQLFRIYAGLLVIVLTISFLVAVLVSWRLERVILDPIENLADAVHHIAAEHDYTVRAQKQVDDEFGSFIDSFNLMLDRIQQRERALRHEIAERLRAEQELQALHGQLVAASRQAGMAEVATGVLHNVGNVLNSVNVSANLIAERLHHSKTGNLARATQLLLDHRASLADFLHADPKGSMLPAYLAEVGQHLEEERTATLGELELLTKNIEHIKDIVARQQSFARATGVVETVRIHELVEDALRLNFDSLARHGIKVVRKFQDLPAASWDKHQVLQILVNIVRNARDAIDAASPDERRITLSIARVSDDDVALSVADTGMGIAPENLTRIFAHGFTTRKDGHGFGLHSAAITARELGGSLLVESAGVGRGATFILQLPLATPVHALAS